eukprot:358436-Chlamydomonas_euryale.AAC.3
MPPVAPSRRAGGIDRCPCACTQPAHARDAGPAPAASAGRTCVAGATSPHVLANSMLLAVLPPALVVASVAPGVRALTRRLLTT